MQLSTSAVKGFLLTVAAASFLTGCTAETSPSPAPSTVETTVTTTVEKQPEATPPTVQEAVDQAVAAFGGSAEIVFAGASGGDVNRPRAAWSTIKVPIAIAALQHDPALIDVATPAITVSDNAAAEALWNSLPDPASAVGEVLSRLGVDVAVNTEPIRPEFSTFGQTQLSTAQLADMAAGLAAHRHEPGYGEVLELMGRIDPSQQVGIGQDSEAAYFKGGWGPDTSGMYELRQFGLVGPDQAPVAISVRPGSGTYEDAIAMANQLYVSARF